MESGGTLSIEQNGAKKEAVEEGQDEFLSERPTKKLDQLSFQEKGGAACELFILPEQVWLKIITDDLVFHPKTIQNVLFAFPQQLDQPFQDKKASWFFGLVLPHLTNHLMQRTPTGSKNLRELLKLRLVSKQWRNAVDTFLENDTGRHPLLPKGNVDQGSSVVAIPENHFNYHNMWDGRSGASKFKGARDIDRFLGEMGGYQGNPFPGKSVHLEVAFRNAWQDVARLVTLLERFGEYVLDLEIEFHAYANGDSKLYRNILKCLSLVPSLRSLFFTGQLFDLRYQECTKFFGSAESQDLFPELRNLRRFEWRDNTKSRSTWIDRLIETYGKKDGLLKLCIPLSRFWNGKMASHPTTHLTELELLLEFDFYVDVNRVKKLVKALPNHHEIRKLSLRSRSLSEYSRVYTNELFEMLAECQFESVVFQNIEFLETQQSIGEAVIPVTSITSVVVELEWGQRPSLDFLRLLPSIKVLRVYVRYFDRFEALRGVRGRVHSLRDTLMTYFLKGLDPAFEIPETDCIWKLIPNLELLSVHTKVEGEGANSVGAKFAREYGNRAFLG